MIKMFPSHDRMVVEQVDIEILIVQNHLEVEVLLKHLYHFYKEQFIQLL